MTIIFGIIIFFAGTLIGALGFKLFSVSAVEQKELTEKAEQNEQALSQYKLDVAKHLDDSTTLLKQMNESCQAAMKQMEESTELLNKATTDDTTDMPFFSEETQAHLAEAISLRKPQAPKATAANSTEPPLDYSGEASGLFKDTTQPVTKS